MRHLRTILVTCAATLSLAGMLPAQEAAPTPRQYDPTWVNNGLKSSGRHGEYSKKIAGGTTMKVVAATYFGSEGHEEFNAAGSLKDGTIVAFGNAWGPAFPGTSATVLGKGRHSGAAPSIDRKTKRPTHDSSDSAGMMVFYTPDLQSIRKVIRFDWGVANITAALITGDGKGIVIAGYAHPGFASFSQRVPVRQVLPYEAPAQDPAKARRRKPPNPASLSDVYVARFSAQTLAPEWVLVLEKNGDPPQDLFTDRKGAIYFDARGIRSVQPDGKELKLINGKGSSNTAKWLAADPEDGSVYYGGDRNTNTGAQPYRQPYLYKFKGEEKVWTLWEPPPREVGSLKGAANLESDSSPRVVAWAPSGDMMVGGWSDGGNSVFARQALDYHKPARGGGMGIQTWGMKNANSLAHIMIIDMKTLETKAHNWWASFIPSWFASPQHRGAPNFANIKSMLVLDDFSVAISGSAATGYLQSPGAFWQDSMTGEKYGGTVVTVFNKDLTNAKFSSYLPGYAGEAALGRARNGLVIVGASVGVDGHKTHPTATPVLKAVQKTFAGATDAHIIVLQSP